MTGTRRAVPNDPSRRARIVRAALDVVRQGGVQAVSHRSIARQAGVPLGSVTYYFAGIDDLLAQAFQHFVTDLEDPYRRSLDRAQTPVEAEVAVVDLICGSRLEDLDDVRVLFEMYVYGNHHEAVRSLAGDWMHRSRASLARHFSGGSARAIDALIEGFITHSLFEGERPPRHVVAATVHAVADAAVQDTKP